MRDGARVGRRLPRRGERGGVRPAASGRCVGLGAFLAASLVAAVVPPAASAGPAGTHLIAEVNLGLGIAPVTYLGPDFAYGGLLGVGGKFTNFPLRFYFIAGAQHSSWEYEEFWSVAVRPGDVAAVPEPQTAILSLLALGAMVVARRLRAA